MLDNILFYLVFLSQIWLLSFYYPGKILKRVRTVLKTYPPSKYPKLYNKSPDYYELGAKIYQVMNKIILLVGIVVICAIGSWDLSSDEEVEGVFTLLYFMLQMFPVMLMEFSGYAYFKQMRKLNIDGTRRADIQPRHLFDFVSPALVGLAVIINTACILFVFFLDPTPYEIGSDVFVISISLIATNVLFALIIRFNINGKKLDPYQSSKDRTRQIERAVKSLIGISIVASLFIMLNQGMEHFQLDYFEAVTMSLYLQFIAWLSLGAMLRTLRIEDINFDVYKEEDVTAI